MKQAYCHARLGGLGHREARAVAERIFRELHPDTAAERRGHDLDSLIGHPDHSCPFADICNCR